MGGDTSNSDANAHEVDLNTQKDQETTTTNDAQISSTSESTTLDLTSLLPPRTLSTDDRHAIFQHLDHWLAAHYDRVILLGEAEAVLWGGHLESDGEDNELGVPPKKDVDVAKRRAEFEKQMRAWGENMVRCLWLACFSSAEEKEVTKKEPPEFDPYTDTSTRDLPPMPEDCADVLSKILSTALFIHLTSNNNNATSSSSDTDLAPGVYSSHTRVFLRHLSDNGLLPSLPALESLISHTLRNPSQTISNTESVLSAASSASSTAKSFYRTAAYVLGGLFLGVTGGLSAPLIGAGVSTILAALGVAGTSAGIIASGLASSGAVCATLFGAWGARKVGHAMERAQREVKDFEIVGVHGEGKGKPIGQKAGEGMAVRICVSGWLGKNEDVWEPWTIFGEGDGVETFAVQWEMEALEELRNGLYHLVKARTVRYVKHEIIKHTLLATLFTGLSPLAYLRLTQIIDNPWLNARSLALKTGRVLGMLLEQRAFGARPIILTGYSLGSLVILSALSYLSALPPSQTTNLIQDVFLFGTPVSATDQRLWSSARRIVSGRLVNGYCAEDYVLAILARVSERSLNVAGLVGGVDVKGVENVECKGVGGHLAWRGMVGKCLEECGAEGVIATEVEKQVEEVGLPIKREEDSAHDDGEDYDHDTNADVSPSM